MIINNNRIVENNMVSNNMIKILNINIITTNNMLVNNKYGINIIDQEIKMFANYYSPFCLRSLD